MKQITILARHHPYLTTEIAEILGNRAINIESLDFEQVADHSVVRLTVDRYDIALEALREAGIDAMTEDALLLSVADQPGSLATIARRLREAGIVVKSVRIIKRIGGSALVSVAVDRTEDARTLLADLVQG